MPVFCTSQTRHLKAPSTGDTSTSLRGNKRRLLDSGREDTRVCPLCAIETAESTRKCQPQGTAPPIIAFLPPTEKTGGGGGGYYSQTRLRNEATCWKAPFTNIISADAENVADAV